MGRESSDHSQDGVDAKCRMDDALNARSARRINRTKPTDTPMVDETGPGGRVLPGLAALSTPARVGGWVLKVRHAARFRRDLPVM